MVKHLYRKFFLTAVLAVCVFAGHAQLTLPQVSPKAKVKQTVGVSTVTIEYSRPHVILNENDRTGKIWGQLVPWELTPNPTTGRSYPWRAGANENTVITFSDPVKVEGEDLAAGSYGFHIITHENGDATLIFNSETHQWGSFQYDEQYDVLRVEITTAEAPFTEMLTYEFAEVTNDYAICRLVWENKAFPFRVEFDTDKLTIASLSKQLGQSLGFMPNTFQSAANYCLTNDVDLEQGLEWADRGIFMSGGTFALFTTKADILKKMDRMEEAEEVMAAAMEIGSVRDVFNYGQQLANAGKAEEALEFFQYNYDRRDQFEHISQLDKFTIVAGMAIGYRAMKDKEKALEWAHKSKEVAPDNMKLAIDNFIQMLEAME